MLKPSIIKIITQSTIFIVLISVGSLVFNIWLDGGIKNFILNNTSMPNPTTLENLRKPAIQNITSAHEAIKSDFSNLSFFDKSTHDFCYRGTNDGKIKDGFAHKCSYRITYFYGFNGDFKVEMINLEKQLHATGWISNSSLGCSSCSMADIITNYYDRFYGPGKSKSFKFPADYLVSDLPTSAYKKSEMILGSEYAERSTPTSELELSSLERIQHANRWHAIPPFYEKSRFVNINELFNKITSTNKYILAISITVNYFVK